VTREAGTGALTRASCLPDAARGRRLAVAKVRIVVESLRALIPLRADTGAGVSGALGGFGAGILVNGLREGVVSSRTMTWQTKV
jgi:hypothetical protein